MNRPDEIEEDQVVVLGSHRYNIHVRKPGPGVHLEEPEMPTVWKRDGGYLTDLKPNFGEWAKCVEFSPRQLYSLAAGVEPDSIVTGGFEDALADEEIRGSLVRALEGKPPEGIDLDALPAAVRKVWKPDPDSLSAFLAYEKASIWVTRALNTGWLEQQETGAIARAGAYRFLIHHDMGQEFAGAIWPILTEPEKRELSRMDGGVFGATHEELLERAKKGGAATRNNSSALHQEIQALDKAICANRKSPSSKRGRAKRIARKLSVRMSTETIRKKLS